MAESKQYVTQSQEHGTVMISEDVIAEIVSRAAAEVDGVAGLDVKPGSDIAELIGKNWGKGVRITIGQNDELYIDCNITIVYGQSVVTVSKAVQYAVKNALEAMAGVKIAEININVCGIVQR